MSDSAIISGWKKKSEVDYITLFIPLWLSLNAWLKEKYGSSLKEKYGSSKDRFLIESFKRDRNCKLTDRFKELILERNVESNIFKANFEELYRALERADICLNRDQLPKNLKDTINKKISFANVALDWKNGRPNFESIVKKKNQQKKLKISPEFYIDDDTERVFRAYIENLYQVRCLLFHGNLAPEPENERVIKALYLTLSMIMKRV